MRSIMHRKEDKTCYLCMHLNQDYRTRTGLQEHHVIFGTSGRKLSEKWGLKVYLCAEHHEIGRMSVHQNHKLAEMLQKKAQDAFEREYSHELWMRIFGRNYT